MALLSTPLKNRVQTFLTESGAPPSAELPRNCDQICIVMQRRRNDDAFWAPLTELLRDLVDSVVKSKNPNVPLPPEAKLLALWDVNELAQLLRRALPHEPPPEAHNTQSSPGTQWQQLSRGLSPNALGLFLLLGLAASACGNSDSHTGASDAGITGGTVATGGASVSLTTGGTAGLGGAASSVVGGASHSGGVSAQGGNGGTAAAGGAASGGALATGGASVSLTTGGTAGLGGAASSVVGGSSHTGGTQGPGGNGGTVTTVAGGSGNTGGTHSLGGNGGTISSAIGGASHTGGTQGGNSGTVGSTGGYGATGGAALTCQRDAGSAAGAPAGTTQPLPASCCVDTASALWHVIDDSTLTSSDKQTLYTCFAQLNATWCDGLVDLFKTQTSEVIAETLSDLLLCCRYVPNELSVEFATVRQEVINRMICNVALYKGVTFPS